MKKSVFLYTISYIKREKYTSVSEIKDIILSIKETLMDQTISSFENAVYIFDKINLLEEMFYSV